MNKSILCSNQLTRTPIISWKQLRERLAEDEVFYEIMRFEIDMSVKLEYYQFIVVIVLVAYRTSYLKIIVCFVRKLLRLHASLASLTYFSYSHFLVNVINLFIIIKYCCVEIKTIVVSSGLQFPQRYSKFKEAWGLALFVGGKFWCIKGTSIILILK